MLVLMLPLVHVVTFVWLQKQLAPCYAILFHNELQEQTCLHRVENMTIKYQNFGCLEAKKPIRQICVNSRL